MKIHAATQALALTFALTMASLSSLTAEASSSSSGQYVQAPQGKPALLAEKAGAEQALAEYRSGSASAFVGETGSRHQAATGQAKASSGLAVGSKRPAEMPLRKSAYGFQIWDAGTRLIRDEDGDGFFRRFEIRFDADLVGADAKVYAKLYLRRVGDSGDWSHYFTTSDFWIYGESDSDDYFVDTTLNDGYPTDDYDVLIDLYEVGYEGIVATLGPFEASALADLPLEDAGLDLPLNGAGYSIGAVSTTLLTDNDRDGFYSRFRISFDPEHVGGAAVAYAVLRVRPEGGNWQTEHTTDMFTVAASGDDDSYLFEADWRNGYISARYDVQIDLYDAASQQLVATVSSERPALSRVPLEDAGRDLQFSQGNNGGGNLGNGSTSSQGSGGGGSSSLLMLAGLVVLIYLRRSQQRYRQLEQLRQWR